MTKPVVVFMGTPDFANPALQMLANREDIDLRLAVTQPDRPTGRGRILASPPVKVLAEQRGIPVYQTDTLRTAASRELILACRPDLIVVAAFGMILGRSILELAPRGCVNLHASLLPAYRGANPIASAIRCGDPTTGVTLMAMERGLDTGPMLADVRRDIDDTDTTESLTASLASDAADLLDRHLRELFEGDLVRRPQSDGATCTRMMRKDDGWIDWTWSAAEIDRHVRAMWPWPRAVTSLVNGTRVQIHAVGRRTTSGPATRHPGQLSVFEESVWVDCGVGQIQLRTLQMPGKRPILRADLRNLEFVKLGQSFVVPQMPTVPPLVTNCES